MAGATEYNRPVADVRQLVLNQKFTMTDKPNQYTDVLTRLLHEAIACTPQEWTRGTLAMDCDGVKINYKLKNDEQPGHASISESLRDLIDELYIRMAHQGDKWVHATLFFFQENSSWKYNVNFEYAKAVAESENAVATPEAKRKWKFWQ
jgi:hypothetical protein